MPAGPRLARRTALAVAAGVVVLTGCDDRDAGPTTDRSASPDPDIALVDGVIAELGRARELASSAGATDLVALHEAHLKALSRPGSTPTPSGSTTLAPGNLRQLESRLRSDLVEAAVAAQSGALAALLASMSAAQAQVLARWGATA